MNRREACLTVIAPLLSGAAPRSFAQSDYPARPIKLIHGFGPGGGADLVARLLGDEMSKALGQPIVVEPRPGAGTILAADAVARAPADGYTLYVAMSTHAISAALRKTLPYNPVESFEMISIAYDSPMVVVVGVDSPYKTLGDLLGAAKAQPGAIGYGSAGIGAASHLIGEALAKSAGVSLMHVPYNGEAQCVLAILRGDVPSAVISPVAAVEQVKSGKLRALAVTTAARWQGMPDVPTAQEGGVAGFNVVSWLGLAAPAGTPKPIVARLNHETLRALQVPAVRSKLESLGAIVSGTTPEEMRQRVANDLQRWRRVIAESKIEMQ